MTAIPKTIYQTLTAKQRAVACYVAINRDDQAEIDRLIGHAPSGIDHCHAIFTVDLAVKTYKLMAARATIELQQVNTDYMEALHFCLGWNAAGGALDNDEFLEKRAIAERLTPILDSCFGVVNAIRMAAIEWCETNGVSPEALSHKLGLMPPEKDDEYPMDEESLVKMRRLFSMITFS